MLAKDGSQISGADALICDKKNLWVDCEIASYKCQVSRYLCLNFMVNSGYGDKIWNQPDRQKLFPCKWRSSPREIRGYQRIIDWRWNADQTNTNVKKFTLFCPTPEKCYSLNTWQGRRAVRRSSSPMSVTTSVDNRNKLDFFFSKRNWCFKRL